MNAMEQLALLAGRETAKAQTERERNRARFPAAAELTDMLRAAGLDGKVTYAANFATGETIGEPYESRAKRMGAK